MTWYKMADEIFQNPKMLSVLQNQWKISYPCLYTGNMEVTKIIFETVNKHTALYVESIKFGWNSITTNWPTNDNRSWTTVTIINPLYFKHTMKSTLSDKIGVTANATGGWDIKAVLRDLNDLNHRSKTNDFISWNSKWRWNSTCGISQFS